MDYLVNLEMRHWSWRKVLVSPLFSELSLFMHLHRFSPVHAWGSPWVSGFCFSQSHRHTDVWTSLVCNLSLQESDCCISDFKEVLCLSEILQSYHWGQWNNRTALQIWNIQGKNNYFLLGFFFCFLQIFSQTSKMLNIYCLHSEDNYRVVLINSTAVFGVTKHYAIKCLFLFCIVTEADAVNRVKNNQILQLRIIYPVYLSFSKGSGTSASELHIFFHF